MFDKPISEITEADLDRLVAEGAPERKTVDFKRDLPGQGDDARKELLYDVSSFANAAGGHLIFGIEERNGVAVALAGVAVENVDQMKVNLSERARDGIRPAIRGIEIEAIRLTNGRYAVVMHIPKSWNPPHQVVFQKVFRFYGRDTNSKYPIDVDELRSIFALSSGVAEQIRLFRIGRIAKIVAGDTLFQISPGARTITHILPFSAFAGGANVNLDGIAPHANEFIAMIGGHSFQRYNVDGYVVASEDAYAQVFSSGCIEIVRAWPGDHRSENLNRPFLPGGSIEEGLRKQLRGAKQLLQHFGVAPPIALLLSVTGAKDWCLAGANESYGIFDRDPVLPAEALLERYGNSDATDAEPLITALWRAAGRSKSPHSA